METDREKDLLPSKLFEADPESADEEEDEKAQEIEHMGTEAAEEAADEPIVIPQHSSHEPPRSKVNLFPLKSQVKSNFNKSPKEITTTKVLVPMEDVSMENLAELNGSRRAERTYQQFDLIGAKQNDLEDRVFLFSNGNAHFFQVNDGDEPLPKPNQNNMLWVNGDVMDFQFNRFMLFVHFANRVLVIHVSDFHFHHESKVEFPVEALVNCYLHTSLPVLMLQRLEKNIQTQHIATLVICDTPSHENDSHPTDFKRKDVRIPLTYTHGLGLKLRYVKRSNGVEGYMISSSVPVSILQKIDDDKFALEEHWGPLVFINADLTENYNLTQSTFAMRDPPFQRQCFRIGADDETIQLLVGPRHIDHLNWPYSLDSYKLHMSSVPEQFRVSRDEFKRRSHGEVIRQRLGGPVALVIGQLALPYSEAITWLSERAHAINDPLVEESLRLQKEQQEWIKQQAEENMKSQEEKLAEHVSRTRELMEEQISLRERILEHDGVDIDDYSAVDFFGESLSQVVDKLTPRSDSQRQYINKHTMFSNPPTDPLVCSQLTEVGQRMISTSEMGQLGGMTIAQVVEVTREDKEDIIDLSNPDHVQLSSIQRLTDDVKGIIAQQLPNWVEVNGAMPAGTTDEQLAAPVGAFFRCLFDHLVLAVDNDHVDLSDYMFARWKNLFTPAPTDEEMLAHQMETTTLHEDEPEFEPYDEDN